jgi:class 3 adenylate cyclase
MLKDAEEQAEREILKRRIWGALQERRIDSRISLTKQMKVEEPLIKPIADLFPNTIMFADVGFTAWSSSKEPSQVFTLLETIYQAFDEIARRRRVFKVETIGDCYVAVWDCLTPRKDHAVVMARFARDSDKDERPHETGGHAWSLTPLTCQFASASTVAL